MLKTFAAACVIATANAFAYKSVPEWVAGFVVGMTGENHLDKIQGCFKGGKTLAKDAVDAFSKIRDHHFIDGGKEAAAAFKEFPTVLAGCKSMGEDVKAIVSWAKIFSSPTHLAMVVTKNGITHHKSLGKDVAAEKADWVGKNYFHAGVDAADMMTILLGPVKKSFLDAKYTSGATDCTGDADKAAWTKVSPDLGNDVSACAGLSTPCTSIFKMNGPCVATCMQKTQNFSASCSAAFGDLAVCGFKNCKSACITGDPNAESCVKCNEQKCDPAFHASTGFEIACKYDSNCNGTNFLAALQ